MEETMQPFIKWPGGKQEELKVIIPNIPVSINRYIEPFVGGGAVFFAVTDTEAQDFYINDKSTELIALYENIREQNEEFFYRLRAISQNWSLLEEIVENYSNMFIRNYKAFSRGHMTDIEFNDFIMSFIVHNTEAFNGLLETDFNINLKNFIYELEKNLRNKTRRMKKIESEKGELTDPDILDNIECAFKSGFYMHFRHLYNNIEKYHISKPFSSAIFYFIREHCYSSMFRYNKAGGFNVPYGGISYNRKNFRSKIERLADPELISKLRRATIYSIDFEDFLNRVEPRKGDFIFLDPPYDSDFSTYAKNTFDHDDQKRLANYLKNTEADFMVIIKNTNFIYSLYQGFSIQSFDKKYLVSFQDRNNKNAEHLIITNY